MLSAAFRSALIRRGVQARPTSFFLLSGRRGYAAKDINFGVDARAKMLQGVEYLANAVCVTMGPKGRTVAIEEGYGAPKITKDGVTVAKSIEFEDKLMQVGARLVQQVANKTNDVAGDGTTCATVLTHAIFAEGCKSVATGVNAKDLRNGINLAVNSVVDYLKSHAKMISTTEEISQVATISANGQHKIGELIAKAMEKVGKEGAITVVEGKTLDTDLEIVEGMKIFRGFLSPYFVNNSKLQKCDLEDPYILLTSHKISSQHSLVPALEIAYKNGRSLFIIAEDVEEEALSTLILNKIQGGLKVCAIKAPMFGEFKRETLHDIAAITGGKVITEESGLQLEKVTASMLGSAKKVTISKNDTIILNGNGDRDAVNERREMLREEIPNAISDFDKEKLEERLARLAGGVAVIKVGGSSEAEVGERKDRITDALNATRAAVEEGILPGGGVSLLYAMRGLEKIETSNFDQRIGVNVIKDALKAPIQTIVQNAGAEPSIVIGKLLEQDDFNFGYDAARGEYVNMTDNGIIDPLKVIKSALLDASSVASLMATSEAVVVPVENEPAPKQRPRISGDLDSCILSSQR